MKRLQTLIDRGQICNTSRTVVSTFWFDDNVTAINASLELLRQRGWNVSLEEIYVAPVHAADEHYRESTQHCVTDKWLLDETACLRTIFGPDDDDLDIEPVLDYRRLHLPGEDDSQTVGFCSETATVIIFGHPPFVEQSDNSLMLAVFAYIHELYVLAKTNRSRAELRCSNFCRKLLVDENAE
jgi:hypothetical protein